MTIHKAKGLEFDTVILPGLSLPARSEEQQLFLWLEQQGELLLAAMPEAGQDDPIYEYLRHIESSKIEQETCRLLYVAATRARKALHLTATLATKDDGSIADPQKGSLLRLLWPTLASSFAPAARSAQAEPHKINAIRRLPIDWRIPPPPPPVSWTPAQGQIASAGVTFEWAGPSARFAGIAVHDLLHRIGREGVEKWNAKSVSARRAVYESALRNLGVSPAELAETSERVEKALIRTLNDSKGLWILSRHTDGEFELAITGRFAGEMDSIAIDRTFVDDAGVRWIIDYKTGWHAGGNPEKFLDDEMNRYRGQLERYARFMIRLDQRPVRLGLYFPLLSGWREWAVPMAMPQQASLFEL